MADDLETGGIALGSVSRLPTGVNTTDPVTDDNVLSNPEGQALPSDVTNAGSNFWSFSGGLSYDWHITPDDIVYVADYQLRQGIVIARASDFQEIGFVDNALGEGVAVDSDRNVYVGEVIYNNLKKFIRSPAP